ncbi:MAG: tetratricopeptide repeat protein [Saprospiraceae bacterium]|nr:tetratricopeptide repeat protein [Saprospiraceae bacterium]
MMKHTLFFPALFTFATCLSTLPGCRGTEADQLVGRLEQLEKALAQNPDPALADSLVAVVQEWTALMPDDPARQADGTLRAAQALALTNRAALAQARLKYVLKQYRNTPQAPKAAFLLAALYKKELGSPATAFSIYQLFPEAFPGADQIAEAKSYLPENVPPLPERIDSMAVRIINPKTGQLDARIANDYIQTCELSALLLPKAPDAAKMLYKAGDVSRAAGAQDKALEYYEQTYTSFPDDERASEALFMHAFTLDNDLKRYEEAKVLYEAFLKKYPNDDFADDAQFLLKNLGKSEEDIFKALEGKVK